MENVLMAMLLNPAGLEKLYDSICEYNCRLIDIALEYDIDGVYFGDDWGQQHGLIMGASHWRRFIKPRMAKMYAKVKAAGKYVFQHSCGDIFEIFPDLIEIGLDCYQTFQPEVYDIEAFKRMYGERLSIWGGISTQRCLIQEDQEAIKEEIRRVVNIMRRGGGYIMAPTHALAFDVPPQNIQLMVDMMRHQQKYF